MMRFTEKEEIGERSPLVIRHRCLVSRRSGIGSIDVSDFDINDGLALDEDDDLDLTARVVAGKPSGREEGPLSPGGVVTRSCHAPNATTGGGPFQSGQVPRPKLNLIRAAAIAAVGQPTAPLPHLGGPASNLQRVRGVALDHLRTAAYASFDHPSSNTSINLADKPVGVR